MTSETAMKSREPLEVTEICIYSPGSEHRILRGCADNPRQPKPEDPDIQELAKSFAGIGMIHPLAVRWVDPPEILNTDGHYEVRAGHRRLAAAEALGWESVRCEVYDWTDEEAFLVTMEENRATKDLTPLEEVLLCQRCLDRGFDLETTASQMGHSMDWVRRRAAAGRLSVNWKAALADRESAFACWSIGHLEVIAKLTEEQQDELLKQMQEYPNQFVGWRENLETLSIKSLRRHFEHNIFALSDCPWDPDQDIECKQCHKRSCRQPDLPNILEWDEPTDECLDRKCFVGKLKVFSEAAVKAAKAKYPGLLVCSGMHYTLRDAEPKATVHKHELTECKKDDKGAKPVLSFSESGKPKRVFYATLRKGCSSSSAAASGPKTMKEKREGLKKRRLKKAVDQLAEDLKTLPHGAKAYLVKLTELFMDDAGKWNRDGCSYSGLGDVLVRLVWTFGTSERRPGRWFRHVELETWVAPPTWDDEIWKVSQMDVWKGLFQQVCIVLSERLKYYSTADYQDDEAKRICELLNWDWEEQYWQPTVAAIPEPKSWQTEKDSTPKKKAKAKS